jgi:hypothetical protein
MKISVKSVPDSFRRSGRNFTKKPIVIDVDESERDILKAEQMLIAEDVVEEKAPAADKDKKPTEGPAAPAAEESAAPETAKAEKKAKK